MNHKLVMLLATLLLSLSGCAKEDGLGVIPLEGAKVSGTVVEATPREGVLLRTDGGRRAMLPNDWNFFSGSREAAGSKKATYELLAPGDRITAVAPPGRGKLVAVEGKNLIVANADDTFTLPLEAFPQQSRLVPVRARSGDGSVEILPLQEAVYSGRYTVLSHPSYNDYRFPEAPRYGVSQAYVVGQVDQQPIVVAPVHGRLQALTLPANYYPTRDLRSGQTVRFTYLDDQVAVQDWIEPQDGQLSLGEVLLAGTLLKVLPGHAVLQINSRSFTVPREFVYLDSGQVAWDQVDRGTPVNVRFYPGLYDVVDYNDELFTLNYHNQRVQLPAYCAPDYFSWQPVAVVRADGRQARLPYGQAKKLLRKRQAQLVTHPHSRSRVAFGGPPRGARPAAFRKTSKPPKVRSREDRRSPAARAWHQAPEKAARPQRGVGRHRAPKRVNPASSYGAGAVRRVAKPHHRKDGGAHHKFKQRTAQGNRHSGRGNKGKHGKGKGR